ncbi:MAG: glycosyltransferase family 4 protein [Paludibacteraceae bacterium]
MRIGFDAKRAYHNARGLGNYSRDVIRILTTYVPQNDYVLYAKPSSKYHFAATTTVAPTGLYKIVPALWRTFGCLSHMHGLNVFHGLSGELPYGIHRYQMLKVVTMHDAIFVRYPDLYSTAYRHVFAAKVRYALHTADVVVAISEQTKRDLMEFFAADERKIRVVYQGCSNLFRQPVSLDCCTQVRLKYHLPDAFVLTVGAIEPRKNLENLIRAVALSGMQVAVVAVGGASRYADQMAMLANRLGVKLRLLHGVPQTDLLALYKCAAVFAYPSLFEGFGIPILEAMCVGVPVLTSQGGCFPETGGEAALYADPLCPEDIASKLQEILANDTLQSRMVDAGRVQAAKFTDEKIAENLLNVYAE